ncbi:hypothetical protein GOP47_0017688 [Adiantum capillus-veneris]|uniref:Uncharacterized protein n=1 Tax=Adiantum capillus-veneris TaxID=13818 RepID=A0A9D4UFX8_ADICA|nr:hypothetical protein GOP47_0017688 [Adiantum capillus-veneris]
MLLAKSWVVETPFAIFFLALTSSMLVLYEPAVLLIERRVVIGGRAYFGGGDVLYLMLSAT